MTLNIIIFVTLSFCVSEIPGIYSNEDSYPDQSPTDTYRAPPAIDDKHRYQQITGNDSGEYPFKKPIQKSYSKKGKLITFFGNGASKTIYINEKKFATFEELLVFLNGKIPTTNGVRYIFSIPNGRKINSITEFVNGRAYIVSSNKEAGRMLRNKY